MLKRNAVADELPALPITPDSLAQLKKEDMKQAVVERFGGSADAAATRRTTRQRKRSPYWQPADDQC